MSEEQKLLRIKMNFVLMLARRSFEIVNHPEDQWDPDPEDVMDANVCETLHMHLETIVDVIEQQNVHDIKFAWGTLACRDEYEEMIVEQALNGNPEKGCPDET